MSSARGQANHHLYLARLLLDAWGPAREAGELRVTLVDQAWAPAVRLHLRLAWGWFLLSLAQPAQWPEEFPACCDDLPAPPAGRSLPGELGECRQLEETEWLSAILRKTPPVLDKPARGSLATSVDTGSDPETLDAARRHLQALFDRLGTFVDES